MIQTYSWNERVSSCLEVFEDQERSILCTFCNLIVSVDELGGLLSRMWGTAEPEFSGLIDSKFKWNNSANGKSRTLRKARTFTQDNRKKSSDAEMKDSGGFSDKDLKNEGDLLISESEKLGVNILGRRFGDNLESFPIKKRFSLRMSQSSLYLSSSSDLSDLNNGVHPALLHKNHAFIDGQTGHSCKMECAHDKNSVCMKRGLNGVGKQQVVGTVDFSGVSILAAAASIEKELMDVEGQPVGVQSSAKTPLISVSSESQRRENTPSCKLELANCKAKSLEVSSALVEVLESVSGECKSDECELGNSVGSLLNSPNKTKMLSSHDGRLNWDLNTDTDECENLPDEISFSKLNDTTTPDKAGIHDEENRNSEEPRNCGASFVIHKFGTVVTDKYDPSDWSMSDGAKDRKHTASALEHQEGKCGLSQSRIHENCDYKDAKLNVPIAAKETKMVTTDAYLVCVTEVVSHTKMVEADVSDQENHEANGICFNVEALTHNTVPPVLDENAAVVCTTDACLPCTKDRKIREMLHAKSTLTTNTDSSRDHSVHCYPDHVGVGEHYNLSSSGAEEHEPLSDVALSITATQSPDCQMYQDLCGIYRDNEKSLHVSSNGSKLKSMVCKGCLSDETICSCKLNSCADANLSICLHLNSQWYSDDDQLLCRSEHTNKHETNSPAVEVDNSKCSILGDGMVQSMSGMSSMVDSLNSRGAGSRASDSHLSSPGQVSLDDYFGSEYYSDGSPVDDDPTTGMEIVEFLGDNHSQFEDGELRESICHSWGNDAAEEVDAEHVDYGSDCRESEFFEAGPASRVQTDLIVGNLECKEEQLVFIDTDEKLLKFPEGASHSKHFLKHMPMRSVSGVGSGKEEVVDMPQTSRKNVDAGEFIEMLPRGRKRLLVPDVTIDVGDASGESSQPACSQLKSSRWDKLPGVDDHVATSLWNYRSASLLPSVSLEFKRGTTIYSDRRNASSRMESKCFDESCRKDISYARERKQGRIDLEAERNSDASRSLGSSQLSFQSHGRGRGDCWVDSQDHLGNICYDTSSYRTSSSFIPSGSRNAAAAAVAKVESSGFVVAPDGTIVKASSLTPGSHVPGRSSKSSAHLHSRRRGSPVESSGVFDMSPDRHGNVVWTRYGRHGSGMASLSHKSRFHGPMEASRIDSALQHHLSRREQSFSPRRRSVHLSQECIRSPSRTRSRSLHTWFSSIRRNGDRVNQLPNVRQQSRFPSLKSERRFLKQRSPQHRTVAGQLACYASLSRKHSSPKPVSRWINDKSLQNQIQEHEVKRPSGRGMPGRIFSHSSRLIDSSERMKLDQYHQQMHLERYNVYVADTRVFRYGGSDDGRRVKINKYEMHGSRDDGRRLKINKYEMLHPDGHFRNNYHKKHPHYDDEGFKDFDTRRNSSDF